MEIIQRLVDLAKHPKNGTVVAAIGRHVHGGRANEQLARLRKAFASPLGACPEEYRQEPGGVCQDPAADGRLCPAISDPKPDVAKIQSDWLKSLEEFIADYPTSPDAAEATRQLGIVRNMPGRTTTPRNGMRGSPANSPIRRRPTRRRARSAASTPSARC